MKHARTRVPLYILISAASGVGGCASTEVNYKSVDAADTRGATKFRFAETIIQFAFAKDANANITGVTITSVPIPSGTIKYSIDGGSSTFGVATTVLATHRGDSDLLQTLSVSTTDQRVNWIKTAGSVATAIIPFFVADTPKSDLPKKTLPTGIAMSVFLGKLPTQCKGTRDQEVKCADLPLAGTSDYIADLTVASVPSDAFKLEQIGFTAGYKSKAFLYSACRDVTITLKATSDSSIATQSTVAIADPVWLEALKLPDKGKITVSPACGADADSQDAQNPTAMDFANALVGQATAIKEALAKKSANSTTNSSGAGSK